MVHELCVANDIDKAEDSGKRIIRLWWKCAIRMFYRFYGIDYGTYLARLLLGVISFGHATLF